MADRFPRAYVNQVPKEGSDPTMVYVDFDKLGIGARSSGLPKTGVNAPGMNLEHVGDTAGSKK